MVTTEVPKKKIVAHRMLEFWEPLYDDGYAIDWGNENGSDYLGEVCRNLLC